MHLLVVGGGSAGHVIPALPVITAMQAQGAKVSYVGTYSGLEERLLQHLPVSQFRASLFLQLPQFLIYEK